MSQDENRDDGLWQVIRDQLRSCGVELDEVCCPNGTESPKVKVVCIAQEMSRSVRELGQTPRDQVVMVRIDAETCAKLDAWVETGAVRSRSEAAALFIREGLAVRESELGRLEKALRKVGEAKRTLREEALRVLGGEAGDERADW